MLLTIATAPTAASTTIDGSAATEADVLRTTGAELARRGVRRVHGWVSEDVTSRMPDWRWIHARRRRAIPMLATLTEGIDLGAMLRPGATDLTFLDQF